MSWWRDFDLDLVFAYDTPKLVRVLDRRLGIVHMMALFVVLLYICFAVFVRKGYLDNEKTSGWMMCRLMHDQRDDLGIPWDVYDRVTNPGEKGAMFIPTKVLVTKNQTQENEYCESPLHNCTADTDCDIGNTQLQKRECSANGRCMRRQWCPAEDPKATTTETHYLDLDMVQMWCQIHAHYHQFHLDVKTTDENTPIEYPRAQANTYPLHDILRMANLDDEEVMENGAIIIINAIITCHLDSESCDVKFESRNVDTKLGFNYKHWHTYYENGIRKRDSFRFYGIRFMTFTTGFGSKTSFGQIVLQMSSAICLTSVATSIADLVMMNVVPERKHYTEQKIIETQATAD
mmetsp:Transcript_13465/g.31660  ORF Transcript_13465/g.31660 Transcript_13465/m.31660 type:complete len:347 (-) Transcript_13465:50-1090(-)